MSSRERLDYTYKDVKHNYAGKSISLSVPTVENLLAYLATVLLRTIPSLNYLFRRKPLS